jgi:hypothetical protein
MDIAATLNSIFYSALTTMSINGMLILGSVIGQVTGRLGIRQSRMDGADERRKNCNKKI